MSELYRKRVYILIALITVVRFIMAASVELGNDEVYYWTYAFHLQWNYFDHPPLVGWLIRLTTANLALHHEIFVRLGAIVSSGICTWLTYRLGTLLLNERAGWYAALLYSVSFYGSIIAGTFILPDSPQMAFWLGSLFLLLKVVKADSSKENTGMLWCCFGIVAGLCMMCKVHGAFLWIGVGLYALFINRGWLLNGWMYAAALISLVIISPIIIWNIQNDFITYNYQGSRVSLIHAGINATAFIREIGGEIFYNNPINFFLVWWCLIAGWRKGLFFGRKDLQLLLCCSLPMIITLIFLSLFRDTLPHWSGPAYSSLLIVVAAWLASLQSSFPRSIKAAMILFGVVVVGGMGIINFWPGTLSSQNKEHHLGYGDFTLDLYGWKNAGIQIDSLYRADVASGIMPEGAPIIVNKWFPAAHIDFYIASLTHQYTYAVGDLFNLHHYYWLNHYKPKPAQGSAAYYIVPSNLFDESFIESDKTRFDSIAPPVELPQYRNGKICRVFYVYRLKI